MDTVTASNIALAMLRPAVVREHYITGAVSKKRNHDVDLHVVGILLGTSFVESMDLLRSSIRSYGAVSVESSLSVGEIAMCMLSSPGYLMRDINVVYCSKTNSFFRSMWRVIDNRRAISDGVGTAIASVLGGRCVAGFQRETGMVTAMSSLGGCNGRRYFADEVRYLMSFPDVPSEGHAVPAFMLDTSDYECDTYETYQELFSSAFPHYHF